MSTHHSVEATHGFRELSGIVVGNDDVLATQTVNVTDQTLGTRLVGIVGDDQALVLHHGRHVRDLSTGGRGHIQTPLARLGVKSHDRQERAGSHEDVLASEVLRGGTQRDRALEDLEADLAPLADGLEDDASVDEGRGKLSPARLEGVGTDDNRPGRLVGVEEGEELGRREEVEELLSQIRAVGVVGADVAQEALDVVEIGRASCRERVL